MVCGEAAQGLSPKRKPHHLSRWLRRPRALPQKLLIVPCQQQPLFPRAKTMRTTVHNQGAAGEPFEDAEPIGQEGRRTCNEVGVSHNASPRKDPQTASRPTCPLYLLNSCMATTGTSLKPPDGCHCPQSHLALHAPFPCG